MELNFDSIEEFKEINEMMDEIINLNTGEKGVEEEVNLTYRGVSATFYIEKEKLYIKKYKNSNGKEKELNYTSYKHLNTANFVLSQGNIDTLLCNVKKEKELQNNDLVTLFFIISEAARFETARIALYTALSGGILPEDSRYAKEIESEEVLKWSNHQPFLNNWDAVVQRKGELPRKTVLKVDDLCECNDLFSEAREKGKKIGIPFN